MGEQEERKALWISIGLGFFVSSRIRGSEAEATKKS